MQAKRSAQAADTVALAKDSVNNYQPEATQPKQQGPDKSFAEVKASLPTRLLQTLDALKKLVQSFP